MNPNKNMNFEAAPQVAVIRIEEINLNNAQVLPLHILNNDVGSEMLIPHMYIQTPLPMIIGPEKPAIGTMKHKPTTINRSRTYTQIIPAKTLNTPVSNDNGPKMPTQTVEHPKKTYSFNPNHYTDVIPESSKRSTINKQIELYPLSYINPLQRESPQNLGSHSTVKQKPENAHELSTSFVNSFLNAPEKPVRSGSGCKKQTITILSNQIIKSVKENGAPKILSTSKPTVKRKMQNYVHISDVKVPKRAVAVLPTALVLRGKNNIFPRRTLPMRIRFGPVEGVPTVITSSEARDFVDQSSMTETPVFLIKIEDKIIHLDVSDKDKCNWMGLLPLGGPSEANVWLYQEEDNLYAITTEPINTRKLLRLGYSKKYAETHRLPPGTPTLDLESVLSSNPKQWWCNECNRALPSAPLLQRHADLYHKDDIISTRRGYRCVHCRRVYSRLFTLRRHISKYCTKKLLPVENPEATPIDLNSTLNNEDNRLPSDESFQNFTNGLDFSTSLFDADRISIDISGNSRADDFNPYDISFRDDTSTSDLSFTKLASGPTNEAKAEPASQTTTRQSNRVRKQNKRKHSSEHSSRRLECACGKFFRSSEKLSEHFFRDHSGDNETTETSSAKNKYSCEQCKTKISFKRRGMLVNHLWRAHRIVSTTKVERPVRHYPCVSCSKIYRSAAKRDKHIKVHHPGAEELIKSSIPGGVRSCEAALCAHCPRQYATRAKLLQHVRAAHPHTSNRHLSYPTV